MTKKDYELIADILKRGWEMTSSQESRAVVLHIIADFEITLRKQNNEFNVNKFGLIVFKDKKQ